MASTQARDRAPFGLRLDGVDGRQLGQRLIQAGGRARRVGQLELVDIGDYAVGPEPLLRSGDFGFGARDAFSHNLIVLAIGDKCSHAGIRPPARRCGSR